MATTRLITCPIERLTLKIRENLLNEQFGHLAIPGMILPHRIAEFEKNLKTGAQGPQYCSFEGKDPSMSYEMEEGFNFANDRMPPNVFLFLPSLSANGHERLGGLILKFSAFEFGCVAENGTFLIQIYDKFEKAAQRMELLKTMVSVYCKRSNV